MPIATTTRAQLIPAIHSLRSAARFLAGWVINDTVLPRQTSASTGNTQMSSRGFALINPDLLAQRHIYIVDQDRSPLSCSVKAVATQALGITHLPTLDDAAGILAHANRSQAVLVVNIDSIATLDDVVEDLIGIKSNMSDLPVVICSTKFKSDDFSTQRSAIADASVRLPCGQATIALGLEAGIWNCKRLANKT